MRSRRQHGRSAFLTRAAWLGRQDSNLGMAESKSAALPLGYAPKRVGPYLPTRDRSIGYAILPNAPGDCYGTPFSDGEMTTPPGASLAQTVRTIQKPGVKEDRQRSRICRV